MIERSRSHEKLFCAKYMELVQRRGILLGSIFPPGFCKLCSRPNWGWTGGSRLESICIVYCWLPVGRELRKTLEFQLEDMFQLVSRPSGIDQVMFQLKDTPTYKVVAKLSL